MLRLSILICVGVLGFSGTLVACGGDEEPAENAQAGEDASSGEDVSDGESESDAADASGGENSSGDEDATEGQDAIEDEDFDTLDLVALFAKQCTGDITRVEAGTAVIEDEESLRLALSETAWEYTPEAERELPEVDFENFVVVAAYKGESPQCAGAYFISQAIEREEHVEIKVTTVQCDVGDDAMTWPYAFARVPRVDKEYRFVEETVDGDC